MRIIITVEGTDLIEQKKILNLIDSKLMGIAELEVIPTEFKNVRTRERRKGDSPSVAQD